MASAETRPPSGTAAVAPREATSLLALVRQAAAAAADVVRAAESRRASLNWREKGAADFVTDVDLAAEAAAMAVLRAGVPEAAYLAEETAMTIDDAGRDTGITFVIDPLDGTTNFLHGFPDYAVSIAAMADGALVAGVVCNIPRNEWFTATAGGGAWLGDTRLAVSAITDPARALIGTGFPFRDPADIPGYLDQMARVMAITAGVRRPGAASIDLASVAAGRLDGFWENVLSPWDVAAGILLIQEAGGLCTDFTGTPSPIARSSIVAANPTIHPWLLQTLHPPKPPQ